MSDRDEFAAFFMGFIFGGITGAVVALLFAPQSGEETRALIRDKSIELRDRAQQTAEEALARAEAAAAEARAQADDLARQLRERGQQVVEDVRERGKSAMEAVRKSAPEDSEPLGPGAGRPRGEEDEDEDDRTAGIRSYYG
jgi:gas vesicle protein